MVLCLPFAKVLMHFCYAYFVGLWGDSMLRGQLIIKCATNDVSVCSYLVRCILDIRMIDGKLHVKKDDVRVVISPRVIINVCDACFLVSLRLS